MRFKHLAPRAALAALVLACGLGHAVTLCVANHGDAQSMRKGVGFHDGSPFTADDGVFSFKRASCDVSDMKSYTSSFREVRKVGDHVVEIETATPFVQQCPRRRADRSHPERDRPVQAQRDDQGSV